MEASQATTPTSDACTPHAAAQARYRLKNAEAEKEKARERMRRLRQQRKDEDDAARQEYEEFRVYCDHVKPILLRYDRDDPEEVAEFKRLLETNPCSGDLGTTTEDYLEREFHRREELYPEWREELADFRDIVSEHTQEELDTMQLLARAKQTDKRLVLARGGF